MTKRPKIASLPSGQYPEALGLLLKTTDPADRGSVADGLLAAIAAGTSPAEGLLGATVGDELVGITFAQILPGRTAVLWPPRTSRPFGDRVAEQLLSRALRWLEGQDVHVAYALLEGDPPPEEDLLCAGGMPCLADLFYMGCLSSSFAESSSEDPLQFEVHSSASHARLSRVVEATYEQTLDCPAFNGVRQIEDVLVGYRSGGEVTDDCWRIVHHAGEDIGCLLLADHPAQGNLELVYMGLVPSARGKGWGKKIARFAQREAGRRNRQRLVLAVDTANAPAIRIYHSAGLMVWDRRRVHARVFQRAAP